MMSIVDLPTELVLEVSKYLVLIDPHHCLLSFFSQTCRRFHEVFTPSIFTYHVRSISESSVPKNFVTTKTSTSYPSPLDGDFKEMAFTLQRIDTLDDIRCFRGLISQANTISRIKVDVGGREVSLRVLACLLNTCVQRPDLHLRIVEHNRILWHSPNLEGGPFIFKFNALPCHKSTKKKLENTALPQIPSSTFNSMEVVLRKPRFEVPHPRVAPMLTGLWMEGDALLSATIYPWTRDIMNAAPLTHVSITQSTLSLFTWTRILSSITIPTLTYLAIGHVSVAFPDLLTFFDRHPSLQVINLSGNELIGTATFPSTTSKLLSNLNTLIATPEYIYPFIRHQQLNGYFQQLNAYDLRPFPAGYHQSIREPGFHAIFDLIASNPPAHLSITLSRMSLNSLLKWLLGTSRHATSVGLRRVHGIRKLVLVYESYLGWLIEEKLRGLLAEVCKGMGSLGFLNDVSSLGGERLLLDHLFHGVCPDLQHIEFKETIPYNYNDWSMII